MDNILPKCTEINLLSVTELLIGWIFKRDEEKIYAQTLFFKIYFYNKKNKN